MGLMVGALAALLASTAAAGPVEVACGRRDAWLAELSRPPAACLERHDTDHAVFHGCIDWHSAVHAHWAVLRAARALEEPARAAPVLARLTAEGVRAEEAMLASRPSFELPYGRAWFLLLAIEAEQAGDRSLHAMAEAQADALRRRATITPPHAISKEYSNDPWALVQLHAWYTFTGDTDGLAWLRRTVREHLTAVDPAITPAKDLTEWQEFFSRWGNQALVIERVLGPVALKVWLAGQQIPDSALGPVVGATRAHHLSMNFSRAWAFSAIAQVTGEPRWEAAWAAAVTQAMADHPVWADNYRAYGHWVSQFGVYALTAPGVCPAG